MPRQQHDYVDFRRGRHELLDDVVVRAIDDVQGVPAAPGRRRQGVAEPRRRALRENGDTRARGRRGCERRITQPAGLLDALGVQCVATERVLQLLECFLVLSGFCEGCDALEELPLIHTTLTVPVTRAPWSAATRSDHPRL